MIRAMMMMMTMMTTTRTTTTQKKSSLQPEHSLTLLTCITHALLFACHDHTFQDTAHDVLSLIAGARQSRNQLISRRKDSRRRRRRKPSLARLALRRPDPVPGPCQRLHQGMDLRRASKKRANHHPLEQWYDSYHLCQYASTLIYALATHMYDNAPQ